MSSYYQLLLLIIACLAAPAILRSQAETPIGIWQNLDEKTGRKRTLIEIYSRKDGLYGKVHELFREPHENPDPHCIRCKEDDPRYNKRILGMVLIEGLKKQSDTKWDDGVVLDPDTGTEYSCYLQVLNPDTLKVRAYLGIPMFGRTQYLYRDK